MNGPTTAPTAVTDPIVARFADIERHPGDAQRLARFEGHMALPLTLSAVLPIVVAASRAALDSRVSIVVSVVSWVVFVFDLVVHMRFLRRYLRSGTGIFDLSIVVLTAPWFLVPGFGEAQVLMLARLARLARVLFVSPRAREAVLRLGRVGLFAIGMLLFSSWMAYVAEKPTNPEFASFGDAIWWGIVTLTTVGYGDITPITQKGRIAGVFLMVTGLATLGVISGTMASMFRSVGPSAPPTPAPSDSVASELSALRGQLTAIEERLGTLGAPSPPVPDDAG